jgi:hypothetical protein
MTKRHLDAKKHWEQSKEFAKWSEKDRQQRVPPLNKEQKKQLLQYLDLVTEIQLGEEYRKV